MTDQALTPDRERKIRRNYAELADDVTVNVLLAEIDRLREKHKASLRRADEINNSLMEEVQRYAAGTERPVPWSVYNAMHLRAANAELTLDRVRRIASRLANHAVGFQDVLDDSDRDPWAKTVGADIAELTTALSPDAAPTPTTAPLDASHSPAGDREGETGTKGAARRVEPPRRTLTPNEYSAAWHAIEGAAGEEGADPGTVLHAVLNRLGIDTPAAEETAR